MPPAPAEDGGDSEPSDEDAAAFPAESRDTAAEDAPGPAVRAAERALVLDADSPASPQEPAGPGDGVDLLGLHAEAGPAPPAQASGGPPSNADLLGSLLGTPEAAPEASPGDLLGGEDPLLFTSPAPAPGPRSTPHNGPGPAPAGACAVCAAPRGFPRGGGCLREWRPEARAAPPWRAGPRVHLSPWPRPPASHLRPPLRCLHRRPVRRAPADLRPGRPGPAPARPLLRISPRGPSRPARTLPLRPQRPAPGLQRRLPAAG